MKDEQVSVETIERASFDAIYEKYAETVYKIALKYAGNHHIAEEIMQSVFMKYYIYKEHTNIKAAGRWLHMTAKHMALNEKRDSSREYLVEDWESDEIVRYLGAEKDPEGILMQESEEEEYRKLTDDMFSALYRKNKRWYDAITITYVLEKPQKEVAEKMGVRLETLHSMLYRAKKWLQKYYEEEYEHLKSK